MWRGNDPETQQTPFSTYSTDAAAAAAAAAPLLQPGTAQQGYSASQLPTHVPSSAFFQPQGTSAGTQAPFLRSARNSAAPRYQQFHQQPSRFPPPHAFHASPAAAIVMQTAPTYGPRLVPGLHVVGTSTVPRAGAPIPPPSPFTQGAGAVPQQAPCPTPLAFPGSETLGWGGQSLGGKGVLAQSCFPP